MPLADGGFVIIERLPLRVTVFNGDGTMRWTQAYDASAGADLVQHATVLMPDGVLYAGTFTDDSVGRHYRFVAIEIGAAPADYLWEQSGLNWARTSAPLPAAPPPPDAGGGIDAATPDAGDSGSPVDAGFDAGP